MNQHRQNHSYESLQIIFLVTRMYESGGKDRLSHAFSQYRTSGRCDWLVRFRYPDQTDLKAVIECIAQRVLLIHAI